MDAHKKIAEWHGSLSRVAKFWGYAGTIAVGVTATAALLGVAIPQVLFKTDLAMAQEQIEDKHDDDIARQERLHVDMAEDYYEDKVRGIRIQQRAVEREIREYERNDEIMPESLETEQVDLQLELEDFSAKKKRYEAMKEQQLLGEDRDH